MAQTNKQINNNNDHICEKQYILHKPETFLYFLLMGFPAQLSQFVHQQLSTKAFCNVNVVLSQLCLENIGQ